MRIIAPTHPKVPQDIYEPLEDTEDYEYLVIVGAGLLESAGYLFEMEGFGRAWNLDVEYDMWLSWRVFQASWKNSDPRGRAR
jgi:hypothetical protein